jgi:hypothetical protein
VTTAATTCSSSAVYTSVCSAATNCTSSSCRGRCLIASVKNLAPLVPLGPSVMRQFFLLLLFLLLLYHRVHLGDCVMLVVVVVAFVVAAAAVAAVEVLLLLLLVVVLWLLVQSLPDMRQTSERCTFTSERHLVPHK